MARRHIQIKYHALAQQYEALMERLSFLQTEQVMQSDPGMRFTLHKQVEQIQQQCAALEQQLDTLEQQLQHDHSRAAPLVAPVSEASVNLSHHYDWGEAPDVRAFHGRVAERATLTQWMTDTRCRLICILGLGGMGKTALATVMAQQHQHAFSHLVWNSLRNAPQINDLLGQWIVFLANQQQSDLPDTTTERIALLMDYLKRQRCLLVLDNLETILRSGQVAGTYREGYEGYGDLIRRLGEQPHQSLVLLTSREVPDGYERFDGVVVRTLPLAGVNPSEGQVILQDKALTGDEHAWHDLIARYSGNPLALKLTSEFIREAYGGAIADFLCEGEAILGEVYNVLNQQFERLTAFEQEVIYWLAIEREPVTSDELRENLLVTPSRRAIVEAIVNLRRRSLIERNDTRLTLQNVVMEYVTERLITQVADEIVSGSIHLLNTHALMKAQAKEYVRNSQVRLILAEVLELLEQRLGSRDAVTKRLTAILAQLRAEVSMEASP